MEYIELKKILDEKIPDDQISERKSFSGGPSLSYLTGAYVIDRMNQVLGQGNWSYRIQDLKMVYEGEIEQRSGKAFTTSYIAQVEVEAKVGDRSVYFLDVGYGDGTDKTNKGKAHELAVKEAVTDGIKRAAKNLGRSFGLELYFKPGTLPDSEAATVETKKAPISAPKFNPETVRKTIKAAYEVIAAKELITRDVFIKDYLDGSNVADLNNEQLQTALTKIKTNFAQLGI